VEADIVIDPLFPDDPQAVLNEPFLLNSPNLLTEIAPDAEACREVVRVIHVPSVCGGQYLHVYLDMNTPKGLGFFGPPK